MAKKPEISKKRKLVRLSTFLVAAMIMTPEPAGAQLLSCPGSMLFGDYTTCNSTETATISPGGSRTTSGCLSAGGAPVNAGFCTFTNTGTLPTAIHLSITAASYKITNATSSKMTVDNFSCRFQGSASTNTGACNTTMSGFFVSMNIGARLTVNPAQGEGNYSGTFTVQSNFP